MIDCKLNEPFVYNGEFELLRCGKPQYFVDGEVRFPAGPSIDGTYRTKFGGASHNGVCYRNSDENFRYAMRRLTGKRLPEIPGAHERLQEAQSSWFDENQDLISYLRKKYLPHFEGYLGSEEECREHHADPHIKRELRIQGFRELDEDGRLTSRRDLWCKSVWWKMKKAEYAKPGKKPRGICDLGVEASLRGAWITNYLKCAQAAEDLELLGGTFSFCKSPDPFELEKHFNSLINPKGKFYFVYFSDDSCLSVRQLDGTMRYYNLDISSCDASHGSSLFKALVDIMPSAEARVDMQRLVDQCSLPLRIVSVSNKKNVVFLKPREPKLMSGSTITTAINNLANLAIGIEIMRSYVEAPDGVENPSMVAAAARVGYILTGCTPLKTPHGIQFLKHSPVLDENGLWKPMLNLGVLIRASMTCHGDLPGKGSLLERAKAFQRGLLTGAYPYCSFEVLTNMKNAVGEGSEVAYDMGRKVVRNDDYPPFKVDREEICSRYQLTPLEYAELIDFSNLACFEYLHATGVSKVLALDYGLATVSSLPFAHCLTTYSGSDGTEIVQDFGL